MILARLLACSALLVGAGQPAAAQILLGPPTDIDIPEGGWKVLAGDLDDDGVLDLLVHPRTRPFLPPPMRYTTLQGLGDGTFGTLSSAAIGFDVTFVGSGDLLDLDGDGDLDWVVAAANSSGGTVGFLHVLFGHDELLFDAHMSYGAQPGSPTEAVVVDLTGEGDLDVLLPYTDLFGGAIDAFVAAPGTYAQVTGPAVPSGTLPSIAAGSFDGDAHVDVALAASSFLGGASSSLEVFPGTGATTWGPGTSYAVGEEPVDVEACDADGDGVLDLLVIDAAAAELLFLEGAGDGTFAPGRATSIPATPFALAVADLDGDGPLDVVVAHGATAVVSVLRGAGDGSFTLAQVLSHMGSAKGLDTGDFDGDGDLDLAVMRETNLTGTCVLSVVPNETYLPGSPFTDLGSALAGTNGFPIHVASGQAVPGTPTSFRLHNGPPLGLVFFVLGGTRIDHPFYGGTFVPAPDVLMALLTDADGDAELAGPWPGDIPPGIELFVQWWFEDAGGPFGYAGSNATRIDVP